MDLIIFDLIFHLRGKRNVLKSRERTEKQKHENLSFRLPFRRISLITACAANHVAKHIDERFCL